MPLTVTLAVPVSPVQAEMPMPLSSMSAVAGSSTALAVTDPSVMLTVAVPEPLVTARIPIPRAPLTVTVPVLTAVASPASVTTVGSSELKLAGKNTALTPASTLPRSPGCESPEVVIVPWFSARTEPYETPLVPTPIPATMPSAASPMVVIVPVASLRAMRTLGLLSVPPLNVITRMPSALSPSVAIVPAFAPSADAPLMEPSLSVWATMPKDDWPCVVIDPPASFVASALPDAE